MIPWRKMRSNAPATDYAHFGRGSASSAIEMPKPHPLNITHGHSVTCGMIDCN